MHQYFKKERKLNNNNLKLTNKMAMIKTKLNALSKFFVLFKRSIKVLI